MQRVYALVSELAELTGESHIESVEAAVRERLERLRRQRGEGLAERLMEIGGDCSARLRVAKMADLVPTLALCPKRI